MRLLVVPTAYTTAGAGITLRNSQFRIENMVAGDLMIVYANELAGTFNGDKLPDLTTAATGKVTWHIYVNNNIGLLTGSGGAPLIYATTPNVEQVIAETERLPGADTIGPGAVRDCGCEGGRAVVRLRRVGGERRAARRYGQAVKTVTSARPVSSTTLLADTDCRCRCRTGCCTRWKGSSSATGRRPRLQRVRVVSVFAKSRSILTPV